MITYIAKRIVAYPVLALAMLLSTVAAWMVEGAAWLIDADVQVEGPNEWNE